MEDGGLAHCGGNGFALVAGVLGFWTSPAGGCSKLVAGEETRSREAGENAKVPARHLVTLRAALLTSDAMCTGYGNEEVVHHGPVPFGLSIS